MDYDEAWKRRRQKEEEQDAEEEFEAKLSEGLKKNTSHSNPLAQSSYETDSMSSEKMLLFFKEADLLLSQLNQLYVMYEVGVEKLPPIEKRKQLDFLMQDLAKFPKPTASLMFRYQGIVARFVTYRDKWDRMLKKLEDRRM